MGFLSKLTSSVVKTALTPVSILKDTSEVITGGKSNNTKKLLESAGKDFEDSFDDLGDANIL